jgi:plastocyanin
VFLSTTRVFLSATRAFLSMTGSSRRELLRNGFDVRGTNVVVRVQRAETSRRTFVERLGAVAVVGALAGCSGSDAVAVTVGAGDQGFRFAPAGIRIDAGATGTWESGARHNVVVADGSVDSGEAVASDEMTFAHTFEDQGTWRYHYEPHRDVGMLGAVVVEG